MRVPHRSLPRSFRPGLAGLAALICAPFAGGSALADGTTIARCATSGCFCTTSAATPKDLARSVGLTAPPAAAPVLVSTAGKWAWETGTPDAIDRAHGGDGRCETALPMAPEDGVWKADGRVNSLSCGQGTAMMRGVLEGNLRREKPARVKWGGAFSGDTFEAAWRAANPDPENDDLTWTADGPYVQRSTLTRDGMTSAGEFVLLTPTQFRMDWTFTARTEMGPCNWSITQDVRKISD